MKIALATCAKLPEHDPDEAPLLCALHAAGHNAQTLAWDADDAPAASEFDAVVLRATWNYYRRFEDFKAWLDRTAAATTLLNPLGTVRWNSDKTYLRDLELAGVPIVPTAWALRGERPTAEQVFETEGWDAAVIKPAVGAGSYLTRKFDRADADSAQTFLDEHTDRDMLIQRFMPSIGTEGERSAVWIDGQLTHAVHKHPRFAGDEESTEPAELTTALRSFAARVLEAVPAEFRAGLLYARIDTIASDDGEPLLSELELIEPSLYFDLGGPESIAQIVASLEKRLETTAV